MAGAARARAKHAKRVAAGKIPQHRSASEPRSVAAAQRRHESSIRALADDSDGDERQRTPAAETSPPSYELPPVPRPSPHTRRFLRGIASALAHLHAHRIAHRDIKPANILLSRVAGDSTAPLPTQHLYATAEREFWSAAQFTPKISDFGLGKQLTSGTSSYGPSAGGPTRPGAGGGSPPHAGIGDSTNASAAAPGSVGWQAPELLASLLRERAPERAPHDPLLWAVDANAADSRDDGADREAIKSQGEVLDAVSPSLVPPLNTATVEPASVDPRWRLTRSADVWSLGCVLFHVLDPGGHPFGETYEVSDRFRSRVGKSTVAQLRPLPHCLRSVSATSLGTRPRAWGASQGCLRCTTSLPRCCAQTPQRGPPQMR